MAKLYRNKTTGELLTENEYIARLTGKGGGAVVESEDIQQLKAARAMVDQVEALYKNMVGNEYEGAGAGVASRFKGITRSIGSAVGTNQEAKEYQNFVNSNLSLIAKGLKGEAGVLTNQDIQRARGAIPKLGSSPQEAATALQTLKDQIETNLKLKGAKNTTPANSATSPAPDLSTMRKGSPERIAALEADTQKYTDEANRSMGSRFLEALPGATANVLLKNPAKFVASAALSPIDIARTGYGLATNQNIQPLDVNIPGLGKTFQREGAERVAQVQQKAGRGEELGIGDYASALQSFVEVPMAALETVGLIKAAKIAAKGTATVARSAPGTRRLFSDYRNARSMENAVELTSPALNKNAKIAAFAQAGKPGGVTKTRFGNPIRTPSKEDIEVAKAALPHLKGKDAVKSVASLNDEIARFSDDSVRPYLQANPRAYNPTALNAALKKVDPPDWIKADATAERTYNLVKQRMLQAAQEHPGTMEGLWDSRQSFDRIVKQQFGDAVFDPTRKAFVNQAIRDVRQTVNDFIGTQTGDSQFKESMKYLSRLYRALDNIAEKNYALVNAPSRIRKFGTNIAKGVGYTGLGIGTGVGFSALGVGGQQN